MASPDPQHLYGFLKSVNSRRSQPPPDFIPQGSHPPAFISQQSDISVTSKSSRVDDHNYGMGGVGTHHFAPFPEQQAQVLVGSGEGFPPIDDANTIKADLTLDCNAETAPTGTRTPMSEQLHKAIQATRTTEVRRPWLPYGDLQTICQAPNVRLELQKHFPPRQADELTRYVCGDSTHPQRDWNTSRKIFVVLILIHKIKNLPSFMDAKLRDIHLPFKLSYQTDIQLTSPKSPFRTDPLPCFQHSGIGLVSDFYEAQWKTMAPFIGLDEYGKVKTFHFDQEAIMPWTFIGPEIKGSAFSTVRKVEIHRDHHSFHKHKAFALKKLIQADPKQAESEFDQELKAFTVMEPGAHLLDLCATFKVGNEYSFLVPWAEGGNLRQFWTKYRPAEVQKGTPRPQNLLQWIARQCHGLASALESIHDVRVKALKRAKQIAADEDADKEVFGIHGDIKPENILLFDQHNEPQSIGILILADFGLTEFHRFTSRTRPLFHFQDGRPPAPTYNAPEFARPGEWYSRKADVWALGCVFTEFLTWVMHGNPALETYSKARVAERDWKDHKTRAKWEQDNFFVANYQGTTVETYLKLSVKNWLDRLCQESGATGANFITDFCDLLSNKVLVCDREKRISCDDLVAELEKFATKADNSTTDDPYWTPTLPSFGTVARSPVRVVTESNVALNGVGQAPNGSTDQRGSESTRTTPKVSFQTMA